MRCFSCGRWSWSVICLACRSMLFVPTIATRQLGELDVISFFAYTTLAPLLHTKHTPEGYRIYRALGRMVLRPFILEFVEVDEGRVYLIGIDEVVKGGYAHVALLTRAMKTPATPPLHATLLAQNPLTYAGKSLAYRMENPRDFSYHGKRGIDVILVDDIITTGSTLREAHQLLTQEGVNVLFALTLADANR